MNDSEGKAKAAPAPAPVVRIATREDGGWLEQIAADQNARHEDGYFARCFDAAEARQRLMLLAEDAEGRAVGYAIYNRQPLYALYAHLNAPEIQDVNVIPDHRGQGYATALIERCESVAREEGCAYIGIAVAVSVNYGPAQRLYAKLGYLPDGYGVTRDRLPVGAYDLHPPGELCLMMIKDLGDLSISRAS